MKTEQFIERVTQINSITKMYEENNILMIEVGDWCVGEISSTIQFDAKTRMSAVPFSDREVLFKLITQYSSTPIAEREYAKPFKVENGDLVISNKPNAAVVYFVECVDPTPDFDGYMESILLINGRKDEYFGRTCEEETEYSVREDMDRFYRNFKLLAKRENLED